MFPKNKKTNFKINIFVFSLVIFFGLFFGVGKAEAVNCDCVISLDDGKGCNSNNDEYKTNFNISFVNQKSIASLLEGATKYLDPAICQSSVLMSANIFNTIPNGGDLIDTPEKCKSTSGAGLVSPTTVTYKIACNVPSESTADPAPTASPPSDCKKSPLGCDLEWSSLNKLGGLSGTSGVRELIGRVIKAVMGVVGSIALIMFVAGGLMWMTAAGNSERTGKALRIITWSSLGIVVIFSAYILVQFVFSAF